MDIHNSKIAVMGLGYVGLPLMVEFAKHFPTLGFDINTNRVNELEHGVDIMKDLTAEEISEAVHGSYSSNPDDLNDYNVYILTVPTPVDKQNRPDLSPLEKACAIVGKAIKKMMWLYLNQQYFLAPLKRCVYQYLKIIQALY